MHRLAHPPGAAAAEIVVTAATNGTFTVIVTDGSGGGNQTGTYQLTLAKTGSPIVISAGDEGGPMSNGPTHTGAIETGDIDTWSFIANAGENLIVRVGEITDGSANFTPWIRLYGPEGASLDPTQKSASPPRPTALIPSSSAMVLQASAAAAPTG